MINRDTSFMVPPIQTEQVPTTTPGIAPAVNQVASTYGSQINQRLQNPQMSYGDFVKNRGGAAPTDISPDSAVTAAVSALNSLWRNAPGSGTTTAPSGLTANPGKTYRNAQGQVWKPEYIGQPVPAGYTDGSIPAGTGVEEGGFNIGDVLNVPGAVDTKAAYDASLSQADRQFSEYLLPQLKESFGRRGLRYSTAIADAGARSYGDVQAALGTAAAKDRIAAEEAFAGRKVGANNAVLNAGLTRAGQLAQIGLGNTANARANQAADYQEFLRTQPDAYFSAAQGFVGGARPLYPQVITGGQPVLTQNPSQLDAVNQYLNAISNIAGAIPKVANIFA